MSVLNYDENLKPAVTVVCITYKHEEYIRQALDSFLMQKTNFKYQIFVGEDNGPDGTADIVREYAEKYPDKIVAFLREKNMGAQRNLIDMCNKAKSPYIAFCEGDDYWTDEYKLQKQYDLMEANPEYRACFTETEILADEDWYLNNYYKAYNGIRSIPRSIPNYKRKPELKMDYYIKFGPAHTSSMFFRWNYELVIPEWYYTHIYGDHSIMMMQVGDGILGYIPEIMSVYRRSDVGVLMNDDIVEHFINTRESWIEMAIDLEQYFKENYGDFARENIKERIISEFINYVKYLIKRGYSDNLAEVFKKYHYAAALSMEELINIRTNYKKIENSITEDNMELFFKQLPIIKRFVKEVAATKLAIMEHKTNIKIKKFKKYAKISKNPNLWVFTCENNSFVDNTRHFFEYVVANHPEINAVWLTKNKSLEKLFLAENLPYVRANTKECMQILKKASVIFVNKYLQNSCIFNGYNGGSKIVRLSFESSYIDYTKNGEYNKAIDDFIDYNTPDCLIKKEPLFSERYSNTDLFVVPNRNSATKLKNLFDLQDKQILICNNSRSTATKTMVREDSTPLIIYKIAERSRMVDSEQVFSYLETHIWDIEKHAKENGYNMHIHISERDRKQFGEMLLQKVKNCENIKVVYGDDSTNLSCYDIMITDFDFSAMDFILQDKPVISLYPDINISSAYENLKTEYNQTLSPKLNRHWRDTFKDINDALNTKDYQKEFRENARQILFDGAKPDYQSSEKIVNEVKRLVGM